MQVSTARVNHWHCSLWKPVNYRLFHGLPCEGYEVTNPAICSADTPPTNILPIPRIPDPRNTMLNHKTTFVLEALSDSVSLSGTVDVVDNARLMFFCLAQCICIVEFVNSLNSIRLPSIIHIQLKSALNLSLQKQCLPNTLESRHSASRYFLLLSATDGSALSMVRAALTSNNARLAYLSSRSGVGLLIRCPAA